MRPTRKFAVGAALMDEQAASTPAATSRTRPTPKACAPKPWRAGAAGAGRRHADHGRCSSPPMPPRRLRLRRLPPEVHASGGATASVVSRPARVLARHTLAELLPHELRTRSAGAAMSNEAAQMLRATGPPPQRRAARLPAGHPLAQARGGPGAPALRRSLPGFPRPASPATPANCCSPHRRARGGGAVRPPPPTKVVTLAAMKGAIDAGRGRRADPGADQRRRQLDETMRPGRLVMLADHLQPRAALAARRRSMSAARFSICATPTVRPCAAHATARRAGITLHEGV